MKFTRYYGRTKEEYDACKLKINDANRALVAITSSIVLLTFCLLNIAVLEVQQLWKFRTLYVTSSFCMIVMLLAIRVIPFLIKRPTIQVYLLMQVILLFAIWCAVVIPDEKATVFPVLLVLTPLLFVDNIVRMSIFLIIQVCLYSGIVYCLKTPEEAMWDIVTAISFGIIAVVVHYFVNERIVRCFVLEHNMKLTLKAYEEAQEELKQKAQIDALTGLLNRDAFIEKAKEYFASIESRPSSTILGILDIDEFKEINDQFGHQAGDHVITSVAEVMIRELRSNDIIGRLGGDEFILLLPDVNADKECAIKIMHRILDAIQRVQIADGVFVTASIGLTMLKPGEYDFKRSYYEADMALYRSKELGKNQCSFYEEQLKKDYCASF
ncbi:MAG: GGDEF domain-containing protein [bacterium]|nr:GGDEF domain-containing protein [bacterium]